LGLAEGRCDKQFFIREEIFINSGGVPIRAPDAINVPGPWNDD